MKLCGNPSKTTGLCGLVAPPKDLIIDSYANFQEKQLTLKSENMNIMDIQSVKIDLIHWLSELEDMSVLEQIQSLKEEQENSFQLNTEQGKELESRLERYEKGEMRFSSWDAVKKRIRDQANDAL
ncbi:MAG TPA: addiction module protein [Lunatimonas sp.]|nr:addiction module protein [Lunatimonas sp.]